MINSTIDKLLTDYVTRQSITPLWSNQSKKKPSYPYCELSILGTNDISGLSARERTKIFDCRFRVFTKDDTALEKLEVLRDKFEDFTEKGLLGDLKFVAVLSEITPMNDKQEAVSIYSGFFDARFSYTKTAETPVPIARLSGEIMDVPFDIILEEIEGE